MIFICIAEKYITIAITSLGYVVWNVGKYDSNLSLAFGYSIIKRVVSPYFPNIEIANIVLSLSPSVFAKNISPTHRFSGCFL
ncbi:hypothetical protein BGC33_05585 [Bathymodiolus thermophilus thioautotrophic gill symbiont]|uniref:Uncharacterized protein n=1 Tax=Bathymodiolus thermophilus thioautotrophic gill symbiont TaxID=2360 RepID=A0A1J5TWF2_9GAMM|nr:hypothetical protein BGC33_05585 [Bathymodiolus thermophilus thioautotrophic gill symbiont]